MPIKSEKAPNEHQLEALPVGEVMRFKASGETVNLKKTETGFRLEVNDIRLELRQHLFALAESLPTLNFLRGYTIHAVYLHNKRLDETGAYNCLRRLAKTDRSVSSEFRKRFCEQCLDAQIITMPVGETLTRKMENGTKFVIKRMAKAYNVSFGDIHLEVSQNATANHYIGWIVYEHNEEAIIHQARTLIYEATRKVAIGRTGHHVQIKRTLLDDSTISFIACCIARGKNPLILALINPGLKRRFAL